MVWQQQQQQQQQQPLLLAAPSALEGSLRLCIARRCSHWLLAGRQPSSTPLSHLCRLAPPCTACRWRRWTRSVSATAAGLAAGGCRLPAAVTAAGCIVLPAHAAPAHPLVPPHPLTLPTLHPPTHPADYASTLALTDKVLAYAAFADPADPARFQVGRRGRRAGGAGRCSSTLDWQPAWWEADGRRPPALAPLCGWPRHQGAEGCWPLHNTPPPQPLDHPPPSCQVIKELKADMPKWVSKYARGGSARKTSARKLYVVVDAISGHFASNG